jgi:BirA family biotin operon repressor/biotin-[acetyl-CoA-carboxylase] ligase
LGLNVNQTNFENLPKASSVTSFGDYTQHWAASVLDCRKFKNNILLLHSNPKILWICILQIYFKKGSYAF